MAHLRPPLVEHWNTQNWSLVKMLPTNNLGRIGRQLILLDKTLSGKYGENEAIRNLQKMAFFSDQKGGNKLLSVAEISARQVLCCYQMLLPDGAGVARSLSLRLDATR